MTTTPRSVHVALIAATLLRDSSYEGDLFAATNDAMRLIKQADVALAKALGVSKWERHALHTVTHPGATLEEAAARVGRSVSTVRRWVRSGELDGYREPTDAGFRWMVKRASITEAAARLTRGPL